MKVAFSFQNNNVLQPQKPKMAFGAGLTQKMIQEIRQTDTLKISGKFAQKGIPTDFKGNKVIAWCCHKTAELIEQINNKFGTNLSLPRGIFVENFDDLKVDDSEMTGFCNLAPTKLHKNSDEIVPSRTVFFNALHDWRYIDSISDFRYATKQSGTDFFMDIFLHEFAHVLHEEHLLDLYDGETLLAKLQSAQKPSNITKYQQKYGSKVDKICNYAKTNPLEAIACDMPRVITNIFDKETLMPTRNPFIGTPYENLSFLQRVDIPNYPDSERPLQEILRRFWIGKFD